MTVQQSFNQQAVSFMNRLVALGDFFICGNERQRDFWLGVLAANGRINPQTYRQDQKLKSLIDVVGVGFPSRQPEHHQNIVRGKHPQVPSDSKIVLWGGGIWNWLDPLSLVKAWPEVLSIHSEARLIFLGTSHPNPAVPLHEMVQKTIKLAEEIGEKDRTIFFYEWIDYQERESLLLEADVGVVFHPIHVETRFSARTRILDYFWARLPVLVTEGDMTSEWVKAFGLGKVVREADSAGIARALIELLDDPKAAYEDAYANLSTKFSWPVVVQPLLEYCKGGDYAPDRHDRTVTRKTRTGKVMNNDLLIRAKFILQTEGMKALLHRIWRYIQWRWSTP
jgi:glycosyltransferase involved in cell wall biosynthesis